MRKAITLTLLLLVSSSAVAAPRDREPNELRERARAVREIHEARLREPERRYREEETAVVDRALSIRVREARRIDRVQADRQTREVTARASERRRRDAETVAADRSESRMRARREVSRIRAADTRSA